LMLEQPHHVRDRAIAQPPEPSRLGGRGFDVVRRDRRGVVTKLEGGKIRRG